jgi:hypothetical protein
MSNIYATLPYNVGWLSYGLVTWQYPSTNSVNITTENVLKAASAIERR